MNDKLTGESERESLYVSGYDYLTRERGLKVSSLASVFIKSSRWLESSVETVDTITAPTAPKTIPFRLSFRSEKLINSN